MNAAGVYEMWPFSLSTFSTALWGVALSSWKLHIFLYGLSPVYFPEAHIQSWFHYWRFCILFWFFCVVTSSLSCISKLPSKGLPSLSPSLLSPPPPHVLMHSASWPETRLRSLFPCGAMPVSIPVSFKKILGNVCCCILFETKYVALFSVAEVKITKAVLSWCVTAKVFKSILNLHVCVWELWVQWGFPGLQAWNLCKWRRQKALVW